MTLAYPEFLESKTLLSKAKEKYFCFKLGIFVKSLIFEQRDQSEIRYLAMRNDPLYFALWIGPYFGQ